MLLRPSVSLRVLIGAVAVILIAAAFTGVAQGATVLGQTAPGTASSCPGTRAYLQDHVGPDSPSYTVPAGGGVITSWSTAANATVGGQVELKLFTGGPFDYQVVAQDGPHPLTPSTLNTFTARVTVHAGEILGLYYTTPGTACQYGTPDGDSTRYKAAGTSDPAVGTTYSTTAFDSSDRLNLSAQLEPDADHDGYGDETQDQCPTDGVTQGTCPVVQVPGPILFPPAPFGGIAVAAQTVTVRHGKVTLRLSCPTSAQGSCTGTDTLSTAGKVAVRRIAAAKKRRTRILKLGKGVFTIPAGTTGKVTIKLNRSATKLLARKTIVSSKQTILAHDSRDASKKTSGSVKLKSAKAKKKH